MKLLIGIFVASFVFTTSAYAAMTTYRDHRTFNTQGYATKAQAYDAGFNMVDELESASRPELNLKLSQVNAKKHQNSGF